MVGRRSWFPWIKLSNAVKSLNTEKWKKLKILTCFVSYCASPSNLFFFFPNLSEGKCAWQLTINNTSNVQQSKFTSRQVTNIRHRKQFVFIFVAAWMANNSFKFICFFLNRRLRHSTVSKIKIYCCVSIANIQVHSRGNKTKNKQNFIFQI